MSSWTYTYQYALEEYKGWVCFPKYYIDIKKIYLFLYIYRLISNLSLISCWDFLTKFLNTTMGTALISNIYNDCVFRDLGCQNCTFKTVSHPAVYSAWKFTPCAVFGKMACGNGDKSPKLALIWNIFIRCDNEMLIRICSKPRFCHPRRSILASFRYERDFPTATLVTAKQGMHIYIYDIK